MQRTKKEVDGDKIEQLKAESSFPAALNDDSNSNMSFPSPAPTSEDSQDAVSELQQKKENQLMKPIVTNEDSNTGMSFPSFNSTENSNLNEDSLDIGLQSGTAMDDSLSGFNLIQAVTAVGQSSVAAASESNKRQAEKAPLILGTSDSEAQIVDVEEPSAKKQKLEGTADAVIS